MLKVVVVDRSAESRKVLLGRIEGGIRHLSMQTDFLPRLDIRPMAIEELAHSSSIDICIIGEDLVTHEVTAVAAVRKQLPRTSLIACVPDRLDPLAAVEHLARLGADDVLLRDTSPEDILRKLVLLSRRHATPRSGKLLLVDSGKGGVGATTVAAALAEALVDHGQRVVLVDFDHSTQALSRFLQVRPFVNESLQLLLEGSRPFSSELVDECLTRVWHDEENLVCLTPMPENEIGAPLSSLAQRTMLSLLESFDERFDTVVVDLAGAKGSVLKLLCRVADQVVFVVNNDPASLYASVDRIQRVRGLLSAGSPLFILENATCSGGLSSRILIDELRSVSRLQEGDGYLGTIPYCRYGQRWPGSGGTLFSQAGKPVRRAIEHSLVGLGLVEEPARRMQISAPAFAIASKFAAVTTRAREIVRSFTRVSAPKIGAAPSTVAPAVIAQTIEKEVESPRLFLEMPETVSISFLSETDLVTQATIL